MISKKDKLPRKKKKAMKKHLAQVINNFPSITMMGAIEDTKHYARELSAEERNKVFKEGKQTI